jgi:hypothetical protein
MSARTAALLLLLLAPPALAQAPDQDVTYRWKDKDGQTHYSDQLPPPDARNIQEKRIGSASFIDTSAPTYAMRKAAKDFPVTIFSGAECGAECKTGREFLGRRGVPFTEVMVNGPQEVAAFRNLFGAGDVLVPSITVGNQKQKGFEETAWTRLLDDAGYPKTPPVSPKAR